MASTEDGFSFAGDSLFVKASNQSSHRRATLPELRALLRPSDVADLSIKDPTSHWWEAQCTHYGLRPSKTKAVAKTRLLDALNRNELAVPKHIVRLEADLKKQWTKKEKLTAPAGSKKRKAVDEPSRAKQTARRGGLLARRGGATAAAPRMGDSPRTESQPKRPKLYARRTGVRGQVKSEEDVKPSASPPSSQESRLGLLNGTYEIECEDLDEWDEFDARDFRLILALQGSFIWGAYDFGMHSGILCIPRRPFQASEERFSFTWRGRENSEGQMSFGSDNRGWIQFLGGGRIRGMINCYGEASFDGRRISTGTSSERSAQDMRDEWDQYNEDAYEYERRARWR